MRFWDTSSVVPLIVHQSETERMLDVLDADPDVVIWWATEVECSSAIARLERQGYLDPDSAHGALTHLDELVTSWHEVQPQDDIRRKARRLLRTHPLRAADTLQLAAALAAAEDHPFSLEFVSLDDRLVDAARREGFSVTSRGTA